MMTIPERERLARRLLGAVAQIVQPQQDQMEQLTFAVAKIMSIEPAGIVDGAKLDYILGELVVMKTGLASALAALASLGGNVQLPPQVAAGLGLEAKERSSLIVPG